MSLRLRLLLAVGAIAIVALVVADLATYSALRSSLYQQADQELAQQPHRLPGDQFTGFSCPPSPESRFGQQAENGGGSGGGGNSGYPNVSGISYIALVRQGGAVIEGNECPAYVGEHAYRPSLPSTITGFAAQPDGEQVAVFHNGLR